MSYPKSVKARYEEEDSSDGCKEDIHININKQGR